MSDESRLSQIEKLLETSAKMIVRHDQMVERHDREMTEIREQTARNAELIERNTQNIDRNAELIERNTQNIDRNAELIERNTQNIAKVFDLCVESIKVMKNIQNEVKGMQIENQRILQHLFGEDQKKDL